MEYRGYDSAGICTQEGNEFHCTKAKGKLSNLEHKLKQLACPGNIGIGHTRWATHGKPDETNAHPHTTHRVSIVHNGIIENYRQLKNTLVPRGRLCKSETDSEIVAHLFDDFLGQCRHGMEAWNRTLEEIRGSYAFAALVIHEHESARIWFARKGSPLLLGRGPAGLFVASDAMALAGLVDEVFYLEEGDRGWLDQNRCQVADAAGNIKEVGWHPLLLDVSATEKGPFDHYMEKEIHEQPGVLARILQHYVRDGGIDFPDAPFLQGGDLPKRIVIVACGTSYHAGLTARYWLERYLKIPVEVDVASEYRYRDPVIGADTLFISLSQSGETADTLEALRLFKRRTPENPTLSICNVPTASLPRESGALIDLLAGPEVGVASTKAFMAQLAVLALLSMQMAHRAGVLEDRTLHQHLDHLADVVDGMESILQRRQDISAVAKHFAEARGALYLGRGPCYPLAMEGALKLKEITYLHAEGYAAGEMKHGPIALIDHTLPVIVIAPKQYHLDKVLGNLQEVQARGAKVILLTDMDQKSWPDNVMHIIQIPEGDYFSTPLLACIPLQLLAYTVACARGTDVDQPRNLAKSVTVE